VTFTRAGVIGSGPSACRLGKIYGSQGDERCSGAAGDLGDGGARASCGMLNRCPRSTAGEHMPDPRITRCVLGQEKGISSRSHDQAIKRALTRER
jgi:hypothetical protein